MSAADPFFQGALTPFDEPWGVFSEVAMSDVFLGLQITVRYSETEGPVPGGHDCNSAIYKVLGNGVELGVANLNNNPFGGDRESIITVDAEQSQMVSRLSSTPGQIDLSLECDPTHPEFDLIAWNGTCHTDLAWVIVTNSIGTEIYNGAPSGFFVSLNVIN